MMSALPLAARPAAADALPVITLATPEPRGLRVLYLSDVYFPRVNGVSTSIDSFRQRARAARP